MVGLVFKSDMEQYMEPGLSTKLIEYRIVMRNKSSELLD